jgi:hypothetical protein
VTEFSGVWAYNPIIFNLVSGFLGPLFGKRPAVTSPFTTRLAGKPNSDARAKKRCGK